MKFCLLVTLILTVQNLLWYEKISVLKGVHYREMVSLERDILVKMKPLTPCLVSWGRNLRYYSNKSGVISHGSRSCQFPISNNTRQWKTWIISPVWIIWKVKAEFENFQTMNYHWCISTVLEEAIEEVVSNLINIR